MKIAFVGVKNVTSEIGSLEEYVTEYGTRFVENGHTVFLYVAEDAHTNRYNGMRIIFVRKFLSGLSGNMLSAFFSLLHACVIARVDVVHIHKAYAGLFIWIVRILRPNASVFYTMHAIESHRVHGMFARLFVMQGEKLSLIFSDARFCVHKTLEQYILFQYGLDSMYAPSGVHMRRVSTNDVVVEALGLSSFGFISMIAPLHEESGVFTLIDAWKKARAERPDLFQEKKLAIVNTDSTQEIKTDCTDDSIVFTGYQRQDVRQALFAGSLCVVAPEFYTQQPARILEPMSYGKAVIAASTPEYMSIAEDYALWFGVGDADELAQLLMSLMEDTMFSASLGHTARAFVEESFSWDVLSQEILFEYQKYRALREGLLAIR